MTDALSSSISIVAYLALFALVAVGFLLVNLLVGRLVRPSDPHPEKLEIYECGEPTIGSSFVQFDLRFYVVALLFIIFDVEVALFFPWATVFGKSTHLMRDDFAIVERIDGKVVLTPDADALYRELGVRHPTVLTELSPAMRSDAQYRPIVDQRGTAAATVFLPQQAADEVAHLGAKELAWVILVDILAFFGVLMIGFLYVWKRGDLDWVRAVAQERATFGDVQPPRGTADLEPALSA